MVAISFFVLELVVKFLMVVNGKEKYNIPTFQIGLFSPETHID